MISKGIIVALSLGLLGCDFERLKKCEWYLVPEPKQAQHVENGWVSLCARNFTTKKQRCWIQSTLAFAESIYGKKVRFSDIEFEEKTYPRKITKAPVCTESP